MANEDRLILLSPWQPATEQVVVKSGVQPPAKEKKAAKQ